MTGYKHVCVYLPYRGTSLALITATYRVRDLPFSSTLCLPLTYLSFTSLPFFFTFSPHYHNFCFFSSIAYLAFTPSCRRLVWHVAPCYQTPLSQHLTSPIPSSLLCCHPCFLSCLSFWTENENMKKKLGIRLDFNIICITCTRYRVGRR